MNTFLNAYVKADDKCAICHRDFADHNYDDNLEKWECPEHLTEFGYGFFPGGDPNNFTPDFEACTEKEIEAWKKACEKGEPVESGCKVIPGVCAIDAPTFGIGSYMLDLGPSYFEPEESFF